MRAVLIACLLAIPAAPEPTPIADKIVSACLWPILNRSAGNRGKELQERLESAKPCIEAVVKASAKEKK